MEAPSFLLHSRVDSQDSSIVGSRVRLDPMQLHHHAALCAVGLDARLWQVTTISVSTPEGMRSYMQKALSHRDAGTAFPFVIIDLASGSVIGTTRFHHIAPEHRRLEIGFTWIAVPWQRRGLNTEVKFLMLCHAFEVLNCSRVELKADRENTASCCAIEAVGGKFEAMLRNYMLSARKGPRDLALYSILDTEWPQVKAALLEKLHRSSRL